MTEEIPRKVCPNCRREKPLSDFGLKSPNMGVSSGDGRNNICKVCHVLRVNKGKGKKR